MFLMGLVNIVHCCCEGAHKAAGNKLGRLLMLLVPAGVVAYFGAERWLDGVQDASHESNVMVTWLLVWLIGCAVTALTVYGVYRCRRRPAEDDLINDVDEAVKRALAEQSRRQLEQYRTTSGRVPAQVLRIDVERVDRLEPARRRQIGARR